jgi:class 3 adenylate cyclase/tetratricopeptide (TPR) repeat protein
MLCQKCGSENPPGKRFCGDCGEPLAQCCSECGSENPLGKKFCGDCGAALLKGNATRAPLPENSAEAQVAPGQPQDQTTGDGERRHLTVLLCELVNSTEIALRLDPEEWSQLAADYQRTTSSTVTRFGGAGAKYLGDNLMVYFGYPEAREDDAERAVRAGMAILEVVAELSSRFATDNGAKLSVRVGIHSGSVVVGHTGSKEADVFGDTPNIASRVLAVTPLDAVMITAAVQQLVVGRFVLEDEGARLLKGIERPVRLYRVTGSSNVRRSRRDATTRIPTTFVGREDEIDLALSRWDSVREGEGQLVLVVGEPGIGKSRFVDEFQGRLKDRDHLWIECGGEQFHQGTPFHAAAQMVEQGFGLQGGESNQERVERLEHTLELSGIKLNEAVPLIADLLGLPVPEKYPPLLLEPGQRRKRLLVTLVSWILQSARLQPIIIAIEDLHWVDPSSLELAQMLVEQGATAPLFLLYTARPEFRQLWPMRAHHLQITLSRLNDTDTREVIAGIAARIALSKDVVDAVLKRTDGIPLFAEELTRFILDRDPRSAVREIPATLQDSLTARLDRLGRAKDIAQVAATIGREFSYEMLQLVTGLSAENLEAGLKKLADAELIYARGIPPRAVYLFKHALIQDAAYQSLLKNRRKDLHGLVAQTMVDNFPAIAESQPEAIARHWMEAGESELAIAAWKKAGEAAYSRRAFREAEENLRQARLILPTLPEAPQRDATELEIVSTLLQVLQLTGGYSASETVEVAARAQALAESGGSLAQLVLQLHGTWAALLVAGEYSRAAVLANELIDLARREDSEMSFGLANYAQLVTRFYRGDLIGAEDHFAYLARSLQASCFRQFPGAIVICMGIASVAAWMMGRAETARERVTQAVAFGSDNNNPYDLAYARYFEGALYGLLKEPLLAETAASQALALSDEHGFPLVASLSRTIIGSTRSRPGCVDEAVALVRRGIDGVSDAGGRVGITDLLTLLAEAQAHGGLIEDALNTLEGALQTNPEEIVFRSNILRCRGELRLELGQTEIAEPDLREAITLARGMNAKALELRATSNLARLLVEQGKSAEARAILGEIYGSFTEGLDTAVLKDAKALLDALRP